MLTFLLTATLATAAPPRGNTADLQLDLVTLGETHGCGRNLSGGVVCWGRNDRGQLGDGTFDDSAFPRPVKGVEDVVALEAGTHHTCAVRRDRSLWCWGDNQLGQLGAGDLEAVVKPVRVVDLGPVLTVALGESHTCAVTTDKQVSCWGNNLYRQLGLDGLRSASRPVPVPGLPPSLDVAVGYGHSCAQPAEGGAPLCWGDDGMGQLGRPVPADGSPLEPERVVGEFPPVRSLAARGNQTCALTAEGVSCWGAAPVDDTPKPAVVQVVEQKGLVALTVGWGHGCAMTGTGSVTCWGDDRFGQLGGRRHKGVVFGAYGVRDATSVAAGLAQSCAARGDAGRIGCWGAYSDAERSAAMKEQRELAAPAPRKLPVPPKGTELRVSIEEVLKPEGAVPRLVITSTVEHPCANTKLDLVDEVKKRRVTLKVGEPFLPGGTCINANAPAVATWDFPADASGRYNVIIRKGRQESFYQVFVRMDKLEVIPLQETVAYWKDDKSVWRIPEGSLAISCTYHLEEPLCERRASDGLPTCRTLLSDERITEAPQMKDHDYGNTWFMADPGATRISPDFEVGAYQPFFEDTWRDGSQCMEVRVRTWNGQTWRNADPRNE